MEKSDVMGKMWLVEIGLYQIKIWLMSYDQKILSKRLKKAKAFGYSDTTYYMFSLLPPKGKVRKFVSNKNLAHVL